MCIYIHVHAYMCIHTRVHGNAGVCMHTDLGTCAHVANTCAVCTTLARLHYRHSSHTLLALVCPDSHPTMDTTRHQQDQEDPLEQ